MNIRIVSLGFFQEISNDEKFKGISFNVSNLPYNQLFHFSIDLEKLDFSSELAFKGGYFNSLKVETKYYLEKPCEFNSIEIIERNPSFFALLIPYPNLLKFEGFEYGSTSGAFNPLFFLNLTLYGRGGSQELESKRFSNEIIKNDLSSEIRISNEFRKFCNEFFDNNSYPIFYENIEDLFLAINELNDFYKNSIGFELRLENLSKIVIPFFKLRDNEVAFINEYGASGLFD